LHKTKKISNVALVKRNEFGIWVYNTERIWGKGIQERTAEM